MSNHRRGVGPVAAFVVAGTIAAAAAVHTPSVVADHTTPPTSVTVAGSFQSELGCPGDWQPDCTATSMIEEDGVWQGTETVPAGSWAYKAALNMTWSESYGAAPDGADIPLTLAADTAVRFYYSHDTHWVADSVNDRIATAAGSFQSELGCAGRLAPRTACARGCRTPTATASTSSSTTVAPGAAPTSGRWRLPRPGTRTTAGASPAAPTWPSSWRPTVSR